MALSDSSNQSLLVLVEKPSVSAAVSDRSFELLPLGLWVRVWGIL